MKFYFFFKKRKVVLGAVCVMEWLVIGKGKAGGLGRGYWVTLVREESLLAG